MEKLPRGAFVLKRDKTPFWNNSSLAWIAFLIPFVIMALAYGAIQVFPFGQRHMLTVDLYHQYAPFFALFRDKLLSGGSLFYSMAGGLGTNFYALFAYYLASPLNLLLLIFPPAYLTEAIMLITLIKIGLAGLTFYLYLRVNFQRRGALAVAFSTFYALSGFVIAYSWNIMWLDALVLLPVVLLALIRQMRDGKWLLYPVALALLLISNYYIAFFACVFIALYYPILLARYTPDRQLANRALTFGKTAVLTIMGVALSAILLYPAFRSLALTSASGDKFPAAVELIGKPLTYLGQLFPFLQPTIRSGAPNLYCGLPILLLIPIYFISNRIGLREKIMNGLLLLFLFLSFETNVLNFVWHGMHYPNQLPYRYSFVVILLLLTIAYDGLRSTREFRATELGLLGLCLAFVIPVVVALDPEMKVSPWTQWGAIALMLIYMVLFSSFQSRKYNRRLHVNILLGVMLIEIALSTFSGIYHIDRNEYFGNRDGYSAGSTVNSIREAVNRVEQLNQADKFYRMEVRPHKTSNDPCLYGYNGLSLFASTSPKAPVDFFSNVGLQNNGINSYQYRGSTLFLDSLFDIKYVIAREDTVFNEVERFIVLGNDLITVYQNPYVFPLGFMADGTILDFSSSKANPFRSQNDLADAISGEEVELFDVLLHDPVSGSALSAPGQGGALFRYTSGTGIAGRTHNVSWTATKSAPHYLSLDMRGHAVDKVEVVIEDRAIPIEGSKKGVFELGTVAESEEIELEISVSETETESGDFEVRIASLDREVMWELAQQAQREGLKLNIMEDDHFAGQIYPKKDGLLVLSIPYDPGWTAYIDGVPTEIETIDGALMAIPVEAGVHDIFFAFLPVGFHTGLYITLASVGTLLLIILWGFVFKRYVKPRHNNRESEIEDFAESSGFSLENGESAAESVYPEFRQKQWRFSKKDDFVDDNAGEAIDEDGTFEERLFPNLVDAETASNSSPDEEEDEKVTSNTEP